MQRPASNPIRFNYLDRKFRFPRRSNLKRFLVSLFKTEGFRVEAVNYVFCSDDYLLGINQAHLDHDTLTDIITFQYSDSDQPLVSDIYVSVDRVKENAGLYNTTFLDELHRVIFHGALHLCGYKDKSKTESSRMRAAENRYLAKYKL